MKRSAGFFILFLFIFLFIFRSLLGDITKNLIDWLDAPYVIWVLFQNISKIKTLDFQHFFNTNAFYPNTNTLFFSDILLPQSLIALPFSMVISNLVLVFNIVFILTFVLNYISSFLFWKEIFKKNRIAFLGALFSIFSPFIFTQLGHFQMLSLWPFFFSLLFIMRDEEEIRIKNTICAGVFLAVQFTASVYLGIFLITVIGLFYGISFLFSKNKLQTVRKLCIILFIFVLLDGIFIKGYIDMRRQYNAKRNFGEYITYSAHLSDYIFPPTYSTFLYDNAFIGKWKSLNKHVVGERAVFPGFLLSTLFLFGLISFSRKKREVNINLYLNKERLFFLSLIMVGFLFSLGPRINFNGTYAHIPNVYAAFLKYAPFFSSVRALARWSFLFYIGILYFSLYFLNKIHIDKKILFAVIVLVVYFVEYVPIKIETHAEPYINRDYGILKSACFKQKKVLLEFPVTHLNVKGGVGEGLNYISKVELASLYHSCYIVNGYSGYDMPELQQMDTTINGFLENDQPAMFVNYLKNKNIDFVKINMDKINVKVDGGFYDKMGITPLSKNLYKVSK